jgi:hypothetical protein
MGLSFPAKRPFQQVEDKKKKSQLWGPLPFSHAFFLTTSSRNDRKSSKKAISKWSNSPPKKDFSAFQKDQHISKRSNIQTAITISAFPPKAAPQVNKTITEYIDGTQLNCPQHSSFPAESSPSSQKQHQLLFSFLNYNDCKQGSLFYKRTLKIISYKSSVFTTSKTCISLSLLSPHISPNSSSLPSPMYQ